MSDNTKEIVMSMIQLADEVTTNANTLSELLRDTAERLQIAQEESIAYQARLQWLCEQCERTEMHTGDITYEIENIFVYGKSFAEAIDKKIEREAKSK